MVFTEIAILFAVIQTTATAIPSAKLEVLSLKQLLVSRMSRPQLI